MKLPTVYIKPSERNGTLYIGVTSDLVKRVWEHKQDQVSGFTSKYGAHLLVYFEVSDDIVSAITREKQLKKWHRDWKIRLVEEMNPIGMICMSRFYKPKAKSLGSRLRGKVGEK